MYRGKGSVSIEVLLRLQGVGSCTSGEVDVRLRYVGVENVVAVAIEDLLEILGVVFVVSNNRKSPVYTNSRSAPSADRILVIVGSNGVYVAPSAP